MARAVWNGTTIAESNRTQIVEGNHYFPPESVDRDLVRNSDHTTVCSWKGVANYLDLVVDGAINENAAWFYAQPKAEAASIADHIAFWKGVTIETDD